MLVAAGLVPPSLAGSPYDPNRIGAGNREIRRVARGSSLYKGLDYPYKYSMFALGDSLRAADLYTVCDTEAQAVGWLVAPKEYRPFDPPQLSAIAGDAYYRLLDDGSVQSRHTQYDTIDGERAFDWKRLFADFTPECLRKL